MATAEAGPASGLHLGKGSNLRDTEQWKQFTTRSHKRSPCLPAQLPLLNRYEALGVADEEREEPEEEASVQVLLPKSDQPRTRSTCTIKTCLMKKSWRVVFIDDSLLKGMEADQTLFTKKFSASLGLRSGMLPGSFQA